MNFTYVIGATPNENSQKWRQKGNGHWTTRADCLQKALEEIFGSMPFPAELTGRPYDFVFVPGICLPLPDYEVIQVWSTEPIAVENAGKMSKMGVHTPHFDKDEGGLHCEISVYDLHKYLTPDRKLLAGPDTEVVSAVASQIRDFTAQKHEMVKAIADQQHEMILRKWSMDETQENLREQMRVMQEKIEMADTYLHGAKSKVQLFKGPRGSGPYHVFQTRQFLNREIGLLANMVAFDCANMESLDKWLVKEGKLWDFLPFERCILVTRIRDKDKNYGCPYIDWEMKDANMQSIVWIRDGKNVWRVSVDLEFDNCVFPDGSEAERMIRFVTERVYGSHYKKDRGQSSFHGYEHEDEDDDVKDTLKKKKKKKDVEGEIKHTAVTEELPYHTRSNFPDRFESIEEWMESEEYTANISTQIAQSCNKYLADSNRRKMKFTLLLQGMVDTTDFLEIPKGTNLFEWQAAGQYLTLVNDYTHSLTDGLSRDLFKAANDRAQLRIGEFILAQPSDIERDHKRYVYEEYHRCGSGYGWRFYKIVSLKDGVMVAHHFTAKKHPHEPIKKAEIVEIKESQLFIRAGTAQSVVDMMLRDRNWKMDAKNVDMLPLLAQWKLVQEQHAKAENFSPCVLKRSEEL